MSRISQLLMATLAVVLLVCRAGIAQEHHHHDGHDAHGQPIAPPKIFLDKSPKIVWYQLNRLDNQRLLLVERATTDAKYAPVYTAILTRGGMSPQHREEALAALVILNQSDAAGELLQALTTLDADDRQQQRTSRQLAGMLLRLSPNILKQKIEQLTTAAQVQNPLLAPVAYAGLIVAGHGEAAWSLAQQDESAKRNWLAGVPLIPSADVRSGLRDKLIGLIDSSSSENVRRAAIRTLAHIPGNESETFQYLAPFVKKAEMQTAAVSTLLTIPTEQRDAATSGRLVEVLVKHAETTPAAKRTTDEFIDAMQLADQLLARLPVNAAKSYRERLRAITVRVVQIHTVDEEMRYDTEYFAVEAGRPVQVILKNEDLMPHNLVFTMPGALKEVADLGLAAGPDGGYQGKQYVPDSDKVLYATNIVQPRQQERLTFTAPTEPGEYPFVCTFPRHWMRMYGVMVVVKDLDAWTQNPVKPKDPIGSNRSFVKAWTVDDFAADLDAGIRGRTKEIGMRLFTEATCAQCHKVHGQGGAVGPELADVMKRWKGDRVAILREILDPSHRIDAKFAVHVIITTDGKVVTGIVKAEDKTSVSVLVNPEAPQPTVIKRADIDEIVKTSKSMMPKALLDRFTKDEVFEILAYLLSATPAEK